MARMGRGIALVSMSCAAAAVLQLLAGTVHAGGVGQVVYQKNSLYHQIFVYQQGSIVTLQFGRRADALIQTQVDLSNPQHHMLEYTTLAFCGLLYKPDPQKVLVVGLGGGVIPREMRHYFPQLEIDVVDIDAEIPPVADRFFGFVKDDKLRVHIADGRMFIKRQLRRNPVPNYDLIVLDACTSEYIPFHLMTKEFMEEVKGILAEDGVVVANVFYSNRLFDAELKTFLAVFGRCQAFLGVNSTNALLMALGPTAPALTTDEAGDRAAALQSQHNFEFDLRVAASRLQLNVPLDPRAQVLTDDRAPVNWLRTQQTGRSAGGLLPPED